MKAAVTVLVLVLVEVVTPQCLSNNDLQVPPSNPDLGHITPFGLDLLKQFYPIESTKNLFFSPYSIWNALVLTYFGAAGNTQKELEVALRQINKSDTLALYRAITDLNTRRQANNSQYVIDQANRVYIDQSFSLRNCVRQVLPEEVRTLDFNFQAVDAAATINHFVNEMTRGKISQLVTPDLVFKASMVLVNAVYFKGFWLNRFNKLHTKQEEFYPSPTTSPKLVDMMEQLARFRYGESAELGVKVLELPYEGEAASMFVLLPSEDYSRDDCVNMEPINCVVKNLNADLLQAAMTNLRKQQVFVSIPKFKLEETLTSELIEAIKALKIRDLFTSAANLSTFDPSGQLVLHSGIHKAVVEVDEEGSEAAAATALMIVATSIDFGRTEFLCNRPFLFFIHDNHTNNVLFMGIYRHPDH